MNLLTEKEILEKFDITHSTLWRLILEKKIKRYRKPGNNKKNFFDLEELNKFFNKVIEVK